MSHIENYIMASLIYAAYVKSGERYKFVFTMQPFTLFRIKIQINNKTIINLFKRVVGVLRLYSISSLTLGVIPVRCTQDGSRCEWELSLSHMLYSWRDHHPQLLLLCRSVKCSLTEVQWLHSAFLFN